MEIEMTQEQLDSFKQKAKKWGFVSGGLILAIILFNMFTFTVKETEQAVVLGWSVPKYVVVDSSKAESVKGDFSSYTAEDGTKPYAKVGVKTHKGIHFKVPFYHKVETYTEKLLDYDSPSKMEVNTLDKKRYSIDNYTMWEIQNPLFFRNAMKNQGNATLQLDKQVYSNIRSVIGRTEAHELVSNKEFSGKLSAESTKNINDAFRTYGTRLKDIQIKATDLPKENVASIHTRMKTEREAVAKQYRSEGDEQAKKLTSAANKDVEIIKSEAYQKAEKLKGEGDAEAMKIYNNAFNTDPEFYHFYRGITAQVKVFENHKKDSAPMKIILDKDDPFAKILLGR
jgi:membrane protease subunit HflC